MGAGGFYVLGADGKTAVEVESRIDKEAVIGWATDFERSDRRVAAHKVVWRRLGPWMVL